MSNGREVVRSDWRGRWWLPVDDDTILFVVKPRGWRTPLTPDGLPLFYHRHKPAGSPAGLRYPGVAPTGPLPASVDFPLRRAREPDAFRVVLLADPQPYDLREVDFLARDVIAQLEGVDAAFALVLGDLVGDDLSLFAPLNRVLARMGIPWWPVHGNHDLNFAAADDRNSDETWERIYGPSSYAFEFGRAHFLVLDDVIYEGATPEGEPGAYRGGLAPRELAFARNYLATVPREELVVVAMHVPLRTAGRGSGRHQVPERGALLSLLEDRPRTLSLSGHLHMQERLLLGREDGFARKEALQHITVATASGSWWRGAPDEVGIPHTTMRDGAPNGYGLLEIDGARAEFRFRAARRPADEQMAIHAPAELPAAEAAETEILVNVFGGSPRTRVEMRLGPGAPWRPLRKVVRKDPGYVELYERERTQRPPRGWRLPAPNDSMHLWAGTLPPSPEPGATLLEVRATQPSGRILTGRQLLRIH
ncbi:MAG: calcineurin-like phosphoesterase C-terminal domain-containing protein [Myxococcota bacterium]